MTSVHDTPEGFFENLYRTAPEDAHMHLTFGKKKGAKGPFCVRPTQTFKMPHEIPEMMELARSVTDANVYFTPGIVGRTWSGKGRTVDEDVNALVTLWADFDAVGEEPLDADAVLTMLNERFPLAPSVVINSGHGLHIYWFLADPVMGDDIEELLARVKATIVRIGDESGIPADPSVFHRGRLLRVPGTVNVNGEAAPVSVREVTATGYGFSDFDEALDDRPRPPQLNTDGDGLRDGLPGTEFARSRTLDDIVEMLVSDFGLVEHDRDGSGHRHFGRSAPDSVNRRSVTAYSPEADERGVASISVWSSNLELADKGIPTGTYNGWQLYAIVRHDGDFGAAAKQLAAKGYGDTTDAEAPVHGNVVMEVPKGYQQWNPQVDGVGYGSSPVLSDAVRYGQVGRYLDVLEGNTEASLATCGIQLIASVGTMLGRNVFYKTGRIIQRGNLFVAVVGPSSFAAKGVADGETRHMIEYIDPDFAAYNVMSGFESGQNLIRTIRDQPLDESGFPVKGQGRSDQRLIIQESELSNMLDVTRREGSNYDAVLRKGWDGDQLRTSSNKDGEAVCSNPHIAIIGGITPEELNAKLSTVATQNGFGNRFLYVWSYSDIDLIYGGDDIEEELAHIGNMIRGAVAPLIREGHVYELQRDGGGFTDAAKARWEQVSRQLKHPGEQGTAGYLLRRGRPMVARMALTYAALESSRVIDLPHLDAALGWWEYGRASVNHIFRDRVEHTVADKLLGELRLRGAPMTYTDINRAFNGRIADVDRNQALKLLMDRKLVVVTKVSTGGAPSNYVTAIARDGVT